ncbi:MAG: pirin family protein [Gammaproteobacteria bacterium]|nr:pirin family protein [Gammaproteobacteria bacterium]MYD75058.1 pirin family protein [Gammaproteobacteria bacterium]MYJ53226.1 pirin family protein [Gammaproteobacteria bacterium]
MLLRPAAERGITELEWLHSRHSFSFGNYHDPTHMGFGALRVINEDRVDPGSGFDTHDHRNMEIVSYVLDGALEHRDSLGNGSVILPGEVQLMSAGTGILHSEFNPSDSKPVHFLQIWIVPERTGLDPGYQQKAFPAEQRQDTLRLVVSRDGRQGALKIHRDVDLHAGLLSPGQRIGLTVREGRRAWIQVVRGALSVNGERLAAGDGLGIVEADNLAILASAPSEFLLFDFAT